MLLLSLLGVAIGVGGVVAMDLAIASCQRGFDLSRVAVTGGATHWITGGPAGVDEQLYVRLRLAGWRKIAPVSEGFVSLKGQSWRLVGMDPLAESSWRVAPGVAKSAALSGSNLVASFSQPGSVALTAAEARRLGVATGDTLQPEDGGKPLRVGAVLEGLAPDLESALAGQLLCDLASAQEELGSEGRLTRIEAQLDATEEESLRSALPPEAGLEAAGGRVNATRRMSEAFFMNLRALSSLSLLVGAFLIYNVIHFVSLRRLPWTAQLRLLGATAGELRGQLLSEAGWLGAVGSLLGVPLGVALARGLLPLLTRTINDLYYNLQVQSVFLDPLALGRGCLLGWGCALLACWGPARAAARTSPAALLRRSPLEARSQRQAVRALLPAALALAGGWTLLCLVNRLDLSLACMFVCILASAALAPGLVFLAQSWLLRHLPRRAGLGPKLVLGGAQRSMSRLGVALAAMTVALSAVISITLMVHSFRGSLLDWLERTLGADLYVGQTNRQAARDGQALSPAWLARLQALPEVESILPLKMTPLTFTASGRERSTQLVTQPTTVPDLARLKLRQGRLLESGDELLASEPFLHFQHLAVGDTVELRTRQGMRRLPIVGAFQDYASDSGYLLMDRAHYARWFGDDSLSGVSVMLRGHGQAAADRLRSQILAWPESKGLEIRSQGNLRRLSVQIFEQTFQVTQLLQLLAVLTAAVGMLGAVAANRLERRGEWALWGCLGLTRAEQWRLSWAEAALFGAWAGLAAWPCGLLQGYAMVHFINRRAFGWSLDFSVHWPTLLVTPLLGIGAASLAIVLAGRPARTLAEDLRSE